MFFFSLRRTLVARLLGGIRFSYEFLVWKLREAAVINRLGLSARRVGSLGLLLAGNSALGTLAGARVGLGALTADREAHAVAATLVAADLDLPADVGLDLATEVTLDLEVGFDLVAELDQLLVAERVDPGVRVDPCDGQELLGAGTADAVDVGECDLDALVAREVDTNEACHVAVSLSVLALVSGRVASHPASGELRPKRRR